MRSFIYKNARLLSIFWAMVIFGLCSTPGRYIPAVSWLEYLSFDKWVHASVFFGLSFLLTLSTIKSHSSFSVTVVWVLLAICYGGALELMQAKVFSQRSGDWPDFVANTVGCCVALFLYKRIKKNFSSFS